MKDLIDQMLKAQRVVGSGTLPAGEARSVTITRSYRAELEDVWDALTDAMRISRWFLPVTGDLRLGGTYQLKGNAGGEIRVCERPRRLQVTWVMGPPPGPEDSSIVEVRLSSSAKDQTQLELVHTAVVPPQFWDQFGPGAVGVGWDLALLGLAAHLAGQDLGDPAAADSNPELRAFMTASSEAWGAAFGTFGASPDVVARAVAGTTGFYVPPLP